MNVNCQDDTTILGFPKGDVHEMTTTFGFLAHTLQEKHPSLEVIDCHLIFNLNGFLVVMGENQVKNCLVVLGLGLKEFLSTYVKIIMVYVWSLAMKRNFLKQLDIIAEKIGVRLLSYKIVDQLPISKMITFCLRSQTS